MSSPYFHRQVPFLPVRDLKETIAYYKNELGFSNEWFWEDSDAGISRNDMHLLFNMNPDYCNLLTHSDTPLEIVWIIENVATVYAELADKKVQIISPIQEKSWGMIEFTVLEINGYYLRFSQSILHVSEK